MATQAELIVEVTRIIQDTSYDSTEQLAFLNQAMQDIAGDPRVLLPDLETQDDVTTSTSVSYVALPSDYQKNLLYCYNSSKYWPVKIYASLASLQRMFSRLDQGGAVVGVTTRGQNLHYQRIPSSAETLQLHYYRKPYDMATYPATTISFNGTTKTINDTGSGLDDFHVGQVIDVTGTVNNNTSFTITVAAAESLTVSETVTTESAGSSFTIKSRPDGIPAHLQKPLLVHHVCAAILGEIEQDLNGAKVNTQYHQGEFDKYLAKLIAFIGPVTAGPKEIEKEIDWENYL